MADIIKKEPLIRIAKRAERSNKQKLIIRLLSVLLAICAGGIFILILGKDPLSYYAKMVKVLLSARTPQALYAVQRDHKDNDTASYIFSWHYACVLK